MASTYRGANEVLANLTKLIAFSPNEFAKALFQEGLVEAKECQRSTPVETGALRATIHVEGPFREGRRIWIFIVAGGPSAEYALIVHEDPEAFHKVGGWKYIERPLKESAPYMAGRITKTIDLNRAL